MNEWLYWSAGERISSFVFYVGGDIFVVLFGLRLTLLGYFMNVLGLIHIL